MIPPITRPKGVVAAEQVDFANRKFLSTLYNMNGFDLLRSMMQGSSWPSEGAIKNIAFYARLNEDDPGIRESGLRVTCTDDKTRRIQFVEGSFDALPEPTFRIQYDPCRVLLFGARKALETANMNASEEAAYGLAGVLVEEFVTATNVAYTPVINNGAALLDKYGTITPIK